MVGKRWSGVRPCVEGPLTRIANRIAKGISGQSDLSPRGEEQASAGANLFSPRGEGGREAAG
ncbi:hypothetical protein MPLA_380004 [Mesorhizobium sp. ORS 3359]|nr:hypothetical protein MPLA_380004 [Mesorhizobium sp. ORS 3359]